MTESEVLAEQVVAIPARGKRGFAGDVVKLAGGTAFAQALAVLIAPIVTRMYAPEAFGTAAVFASIAGLVGVIACLRYELAIVLPDRDEDAANLLVISLCFSVGVAGFTALLVPSASQPIVRWLNAPGLTPYLWLVPLAILITGVGLGLRYWNIRAQRFGLLSALQMTASTSSAAAKLGAGLQGFVGAGSLIGAKLLSESVAALGLAWRAWRDDRGLLRHVRWQTILDALQRYRKFPLVTTWSGLLNTLSLQLPAVLLSAFFSQTVVGYYSLATLILRLPVALIGRAIADVFFPQASIAYHEGKLAILVESAVGRLTALGLLPMLSLLIIGPEAFTIVLGSQWGEAGVYAQMLSPWILLVLVTSPITTTYIVSERQGTGLAFDIVLLFTRLASLVVGGVLKDARLALLLYGGSSAFIWVCLLAWLIHLSEASANRVLRDLSTALLYASPALCSLIAGRLWMHLPGWALLVTAACGAALYYALVSRRDPAVRRWAFSVYSRLVTRG